MTISYLKFEFQNGSEITHQFFWTRNISATLKESIYLILITLLNNYLKNICLQIFTLI